MKLQHLHKAKLNPTNVILRKQNWQKLCESISTITCNAMEFLETIRGIQGRASNPLPLLKYKYELSGSRSHRKG